jgi:hypothetical protein
MTSGYEMVCIRDAVGSDWGKLTRRSLIANNRQIETLHGKFSLTSRHFPMLS